jgi:hypothetical protein
LLDVVDVRARDTEAFQERREPRAVPVDELLD